MAHVFIPPLLREFTAGQLEVTAEGRTLRQVIASLEARHPGISGRLQNGDRIADGIAVAVDGTVTTRGLLTPVAPESEIHFLPAVSGG